MFVPPPKIRRGQVEAKNAGRLPPSLPRMGGGEIGEVFVDEPLLFTRDTFFGFRQKILRLFHLWPRSQRFPAGGANVRHQTRSRPDGLHF
jgi:hypothetical protein